MEVGSTLVLSIMVDQTLWGLISCQHKQATKLPLPLRRACHSFAISASYILKGLLLQQDNQARQSIAADCKNIESQFSKTQTKLPDVVEHCSAQLLKLGQANAGAFWSGGKVFTFGQWPENEIGDEILAYTKQTLQTTRNEAIFEEHMGLLDNAQSTHWQSKYCGLAAVNLDPFASTGLLWLRPEHTREVMWGGDPNKPVQTELDEQGKPILSPRNSFATWRQEVKEKCRAWTTLDRYAITSLLGLQQILSVRESLIQVRLSDVHFRSLISLQSEAYWQMNGNGQLEIFSRDLFFRPDEFLGKSLTSLFEPYCDAGQIDELKAKIEARKPFRLFELSGHLSASDERFHYSINGEPIKDADGQFNGMHGTVSDITAVKEQSLALEKARDLADQANRAKSTFLAMMSHEIRTPLNALIGLSYLLENSITDAKHQQILKRMKTAGHSLMALINDVLDFAKIEAQELVLVEKPIQLPKLIEEVREVLDIQALNKGLSLNFETIPDDLPTTLIADSTRVKQVLLNLINNAIKFTDQGFVTVEISKGKKAPKGHYPVVFNITDSGQGIASEQLKKLFSPFVQAHNGVSKGGTGLGLAIVKQLVELMGGKISLTSEQGQGTRVCVELSFSIGTNQEEASSSDNVVHLALTEDEVLDLIPENKPLAGIHVLLVDDNELNLMVAENILCIHGAEVSTCSNGQETLNYLIEGNHTDIVLMDVQMPIMDGIEATKKIRDTKRFDNLPIIALTATSTQTDQNRTVEAGMNGHLTKPLEPTSIVKTIRNFVKDKQLCEKKLESI